MQGNEVTRCNDTMQCKGLEQWAMRIEDPRTVIKVPRESIKKLEVYKAVGKTSINREEGICYDRVRGTCRV